MGFLSPPRAPASLSPPPPAPLPPKNVTIGGTAIDRAAQRRRSSLANAPGQNRSLLTGDFSGKEPLGV